MYSGERVHVLSYIFLSEKFLTRDPILLAKISSRALCASMQNDRARWEEGGVTLRKDQRKTISLSLDRCRVALDTPLVEVGLCDNESLDVATRKGMKEGRFRSHDREDFRGRSWTGFPQRTPPRENHGIVVACFEYLFCYISGAFIISISIGLIWVLALFRSLLSTVEEYNWNFLSRKISKR